MGVKTHIRRLRQKLAGALGDPELIQTLPGLGYVLRQGPSLIEIGRFAGHDGGAGQGRRPVVGSGA